MPNKKISLDDTGERMIPGYHKGTVMYAEHMTRYTAAESIVKGKIVLDIASGSGYGTKLLANSAKKVFGVDIDKSAVEYAKQNFSASNIEFKVGDGEKIPLEDNSVDVVITFETIEHVKDYKKFIKEIKRVLKKDGIAIISTPNDLEFTEGNHFHLHEFEYTELTDLLRKDFKNIDSYFQATWVSVAIAPEKLIKNECEYDSKTYNYMPLERDKYLYFYLVCSDGEIVEKIAPLNAYGGHYSARELTEIQQLNEKNISDYKIVLENANKELERVNNLYSEAQRELEHYHRSKLGRLRRKIGQAKKDVFNNGKKERK